MPRKSKLKTREVTNAERTLVLAEQGNVFARIALHRCPKCNGEYADHRSFWRKDVQRHHFVKKGETTLRQGMFEVWNPRLLCPGGSLPEGAVEDNRKLLEREAPAKPKLTDMAVEGPLFSETWIV